MAFTQLPDKLLDKLLGKLLDKIITYLLPQDFKSIGLTSKTIHARCTALLAHHRALKLRFNDFEYYLRPRELVLMSASDLITHIAASPVVARYIKSATFEMDSRHLFRKLPKSVPPLDQGGPVIDLFANSVCLKDAGLDWKEYYAVFEADVKGRRYSQHGAAFLLTLLPSMERLVLPRAWKLNETTERLMEAVVERARKSRWCKPASLAKLRRLETGVYHNPSDWFDLRWASQLLALPSIQSFRGPSCVALEDIPNRLGFGNSRYIAASLRSATLLSSCIDHVGIGDFLKHTPSLRILRYSHGTKTDIPSRAWDICKFITAIEREAGSQLKQLSICIHATFSGSIIPGKASIRGFQRLNLLEIPLELVMCNIAASDEIFNPLAPFIDLVPDSVTRLSLVSKGTDRHEEALKALDRHFRCTYEPQVSELQEVHISCHYSSDDVYKEVCDRVVKAGSVVGVVVLLRPFPSTHSERFAWDGAA